MAPILAARRDLWPLQQQGEGEGGAAADEAAADLALFVRVAGLVQSRAFHLEAENWVSGAKEVRTEDEAAGAGEGGEGGGGSRERNHMN